MPKASIKPQVARLENYRLPVILERFQALVEGGCRSHVGFTNHGDCQPLGIDADRHRDQGFKSVGGASLCEELVGDQRLPWNVGTSPGS